MSSAQPVTLVALAPQTNIAMLLTLHPEVTENLDRIVFMGGSASTGNITAVAEFNVWQDPEAATCVLESAVPTTMYGLDVFSRLTVDHDTADRLAQAADPAHRVAGELLYRRGARSDRPGHDYVGLIGDAGALVYLTEPQLFVCRKLPVRVNLSGIGRGQTIVDQREIAQDAERWTSDPWPRIDVVLDADLAAAAARYVEVLGLS
jgi:pyrimidine-specific ribonucleoside hydrolase